MTTAVMIMPVAYRDLSHTYNKLGVLLYQLSFPDTNHSDYWQRWANQPLPQAVLNVLRGIGEHRRRLLRLQDERIHLMQQFRDLEHRLLIKEDLLKIQGFLHNEYLQLVSAEKRELTLLAQFIEKQTNEIQNNLNNSSKNEQAMWQSLIKEQFKVIMEELKRLRRQRELDEFRREFNEDI